MESLRTRSLCWIIGIFLLTGCGGSGDRPDLGQVTGTVFMDGEPLPLVWVMFNPTTGGRTSMGRSNEIGQYKLMYLDGVEGANIGPHKVAVLSYHEDEIEELRLNTGKPVKEPIPAKYNTETTLEEEVMPGPNVIDIYLESE